MRDPARARIEAGPRVELVAGDVVTGAGMDDRVNGCDAVVHLVGIIFESGSNTFENVHHLGTRRVVDAARRHGICRFVQMSALGVRADGISKYQTSKWKGEEAVRQSGIPFCIQRPSLIFGPGDGFVTQMLDIMRKAKVVRPVPGDGRPKFRPVFVEDVAYCFSQALVNDKATNRTIDLGGAEELTLDEALAAIAQAAGIRKRPVHVPMPLMFLAGAVAQSVLPRPPVTVGQLRMLQEGSTCDVLEMKEIFAFNPVGFREGLSRYLRPGL